MFSKAATVQITGGSFTVLNQSRLHSLQNPQISKVEQNIVHSETLKVPLHILVDAVSPAALHNSGAIYDPPTCHPGTRIALMDNLTTWSMRKDGEGKGSSIMWLYGRAGAGKSAIAQTLADQLSPGPLLGSFFFSRTDPTRNNARSFVATLVYQIYLHVPLLQKSCILSAIQESPHVLSQSISSQFETLVSRPLRDLFRNGYFQDVNSRRLIIIDGLDECADQEAQLEVLGTILRAVSANVPFLFLLSSRPESHIQAAFNSLSAPLERMSLDHIDASYTDIHMFIHDHIQSCRKTHPFRRYLPPEWPSEKDIASLITNSSGHFIYAATVMKFIDSPRHMPTTRLASVLELRVSEPHLPFAQLDALYAHVLRSADNTADLLRILALLDYSKNSLPISLVDAILQISSEEPEHVVSGIASLVSISHRDKCPYLSIQHASLAGFLRDRNRSLRYGIHLTDSSEIVYTCTQYLERSRLHSASLAVLKKLIDGPVGEIVVDTDDLDDPPKPLRAAQAANFCLRYLCERTKWSRPWSLASRRGRSRIAMTVHQRTLDRDIFHAEVAIRASPPYRRVPPTNSVVTKRGRLTDRDCHRLVYRTALIYLTKLLRLAGMSPELQARCQLQTLSPTSIEFPAESRMARRAMVAYAQRWVGPPTNEFLSSASHPKWLL